MSNVHIPVLLDEILGFVKEEYKLIFDGTFGGGGHTKGFLERFKDITVIATDIDEDALLKGKELEERYKDRLILRKANFRNVDSILSELKVEKVDFFLADLGVSSNLLEDEKRGFSFMKEGPLDMRMDKDLEIDASYVINYLSAGELADIFKNYGEEPRALQIAKRIVEERKKEPILTTKRLSDIVCKIVKKRGRIHPATLIFQALRIYVNKELQALDDFLNKSISYLNIGGRVGVISFHSLEDRIVKNFFRDNEKKGIVKTLTKKPIKPSYEEIRLNRRARSAKLRVAEKIV